MAEAAGTPSEPPGLRLALPVDDGGPRVRQDPVSAAPPPLTLTTTKFRVRETQDVAPGQPIEQRAPDRLSGRRKRERDRLGAVHL